MGGADRGKLWRWQWRFAGAALRPVRERLGWVLARRGKTRRQGRWIGTSGGGSTGHGGSGVAQAKRALWPRPEHARQAFDKMPALARRLGWSCKLIGWLGGLLKI